MNQYIKYVLDVKDLNNKNKDKYFKQFGIDSNVCAYCGSNSANTLDHIFSVINDSKFTGYDNSRKNLLPCCQMCNSSKGKKTIYEWLDSDNLTDYAITVKNQPGYEGRRALIDNYIKVNKSCVKSMNDEVLSKMNKKAEEFKKLEVEFLNKLDETMFKDKKYYESIK